MKPLLLLQRATSCCKTGESSVERCICHQKHVSLINRLRNDVLVHKSGINGLFNVCIVNASLILLLLWRQLLLPFLNKSCPCMSMWCCFTHPCPSVCWGLVLECHFVCTRVCMLLFRMFYVLANEYFSNLCVFVSACAEASERVCVQHPSTGSTLECPQWQRGMAAFPIQQLPPTQNTTTNVILVLSHTHTQTHTK